MKIGILGATGYVGSRLTTLARESGHEPIPFSRLERPGHRLVAPAGKLDFSGLDAVVNLAGEPILGLWTREKRRRILQSRVDGTKRIAAHLGDGPRIWINASAVGFYGDTGDGAVDESSPAGRGFLADVCREWESATRSAEEACVRVVRLRIGFVTGPGGAMRLVRPVFQAGLGGPLGSGRQWMSCIHVDDVAGMILWSISNGEISGAVNAVLPEPVRNIDFTKSLAHAVGRPAIFPAPAFLLKTLLGDLSHVLLDSVRVRPQVALQHGYPFRHPTLDQALRAL